MHSRNIVILFVFISAIILFPLVVEAKMVSVARSKVNMRSGPGTHYPVIFELFSGYPLQVIKAKGNWLRVRDFENDTGWIYKPLTSRQPHLIVKKKIINIRKGPGIRNKIVGKAYYGVVFSTLKRIGSAKDGWVQVKHSTGLVGWVKRSLLWGW